MIIGSRWWILILIPLVIYALILFKFQSPLYIVSWVETGVRPDHDADGSVAAEIFPNTSHAVHTGHPIEQLWVRGHERYREMILRQSKTVDEAIVEYARRYGRLPPRGFDGWVALALRHNFLLIDEFDSMTRQFEQFARYPPTRIRKQVADAMAFTRGDLIELKIHGHRLDMHSDGIKSSIPKHWKSVLSKHQDFLQLLPDMTLIINNLDEPMVVVPDPGRSHNDASVPDEMHFLDLGQLLSWEAIRISCPAPIQDDGNGDQFIVDPHDSKDVCKHGELSKIHGFLMEPESLTVTHSPVPIWSQAKVSTFADLLYPSPHYSATADEYQESEDVAWKSKQGSLYWRGSTTGSHSTVDNWRQLHRQRMVLSTMQDQVVDVLKVMENGTWMMENASSQSLQDLFATQMTAVIQCEEGACEEQRAALQVDGHEREAISSSYLYKYALDMDGNSFSGRFYRLLRSRSAVVKQTIFEEWHDDWLIPWVHYIPLSVRGEEMWEMMRWFGRTSRGDEVGQSIGEEGSKWARRVLRKIDMELVLLRLLLEYGRLFDDSR